MMLSSAEVLMLRARSGGKAGKLDDEAKDCASVAVEFGACFLQDCENVLCFGNVDKVSTDSFLAAVENAVTVKEEKVEESRVKNKLKEGRCSVLKNFSSEMQEMVEKT